jgi:SAM-dependent methyltransferase
MCFRYLQSVVQANASICDVGCGEGSGIEHLRELGYRRLIGAEISGERLRRARRRLGDGVKLIQIEPHGALPLRDGSVDVVISAAVVEHTVDPFEHVRELARVVRPGGAVILASDCYSYRILQVLGIYRAVQPVDRAIFPATLVGYFKKCGLRLVHSEGFPIPGEEFRIVRLTWMRLRKTLKRLLGRQTPKSRPGASVVGRLTHAVPAPRPWRPNSWLSALPMLIFSDENVFFLVKPL